MNRRSIRWLITIILSLITASNASSTSAHSMLHIASSPWSKANLIQFHWITTGSFILLILLTGILITRLGTKSNSTSSLYYYLFKKQFITSKYAIVNDLFRYTLGEIVMMIVYMSCVVTWFMFGFINERKPHSYIEKVAKGFGYVSVFNMALVLLPVSRHSVWTWIFNISFERAVRFHRYIGCSTVLFVTIHFITEGVTSYYKPSGLWRLFTWNNQIFQKVNILSGFIAWVAMVFLSIAALPILRRYLWDVFQFVHFVFGVVSFVFAHVHLPYKMMIPFTALSLVLYSTDLIIRYAAYFGNVNFINKGFTSVRKCEITAHEDLGVTTVILTLDRLSFSMSDVSEKKSLLSDSNDLNKMEEQYKRHCIGKYIHLWVWEISAWESHPFSITSVSMPDEATVLMRLDVKETGKTNGAWAGKLNWLADVAQPVSVMARFDGPFGSLTVPLDEPKEIKKYDAILTFAGGIGISAVKSLVEYCQIYNPKTHLFWVVRSPAYLRLYPSLLTEQSKQHTTTYVTRATNRELQSDNYVVGRPNFEKAIERYLENTIKTSEELLNVAVAICGPTSMCLDVLQACKHIESNMKGIRFHIHTECFEL
jgi:ferric-chelate reductase